MFNTVLIANRGEIACRIQATLRALGVRSVAVYSEADADARHVLEADEAVCLGPAPAQESYLNISKIIAGAKATGAEAIHPGYGFLSENAAFAEACAEAGITFIGPSPEHLRAFGLKHRARVLAEEHGVPLVPGSGVLTDVEEAVGEAERIGYPIILKSSGGGGGIGMARCDNATELRERFDQIARLAERNFASAAVFLEAFITPARHIEVQFFGDGNGTVSILGERDCSPQRRNQKVVEESPAPNLDPETRQAMFEAARALMAGVSYASAGTVEYVYDTRNGAWYFLEVNTRLQVEHPVTEARTGIDLVDWMIRLAAGETLELADPPSTGHAFEVRVYAEDPGKDFRPCAGQLTRVRYPANARVDAWVESGSVVSPHYDAMIAKIIVHAEDREAAMTTLATALDEARFDGIETNLAYLRQIIANPNFRAGQLHTRMLDEIPYEAPLVDVLDGGTQTSVQAWPGRLGFWHVGVPPSGPMDDLAFRFANRLLGNETGAAGLECAVNGPTLQFRTATTICLTGADMGAQLDGNPVVPYTPTDVAAGAVLRLGRAEGPGLRAYLAVRGGLDVPTPLGSAATFMLGKFGGHGGRALRAGDVLRVSIRGAAQTSSTLPEAQRPALSRTWTIGVLYGPHGAPDFFTDEDIDAFFAADWEIHHNSDRTGVRLIGPKPEWARPDGGEAGLHPSNIHDNPYALGTIDFTGDMPVILGPDGPSLGGFVCPATIAAAERWKIGQLRPGDSVRFVRLDRDQAKQLEQQQSAWLENLEAPTAQPASRIPDPASRIPILVDHPPSGERPRLVVRQAGDRNLLIELGPQQLDIEVRLRVHLLMQAVAERQREGRLDGLVDLTPGIRSLQIHFAPPLDAATLLALIAEIESELPPVEAMEVPSRIVHLPLSWNDPSIQEAIEKYTTSVRPGAPWCPSNLEFIRRINGLSSIDDVQRILFDANYLVLGLGDVYLGAPVATPVDPRHRLVTTKYNPARTWTPENAVGIGGAYLCIYGMEGPGGYQLMGRTVQMWNRYRSTAEFEPGTPWLLRFFDQVRFFPVSHEELTAARAEFPSGRYPIRIEETTFRLADYREFLAENETGINAFKASQQSAFEAERQDWIATGQATYTAPEPKPPNTEAINLPPGCLPVSSPVAGNVWTHLEPGTAVAAGAAAVVIESMKMEVPAASPADGTLAALYVKAGDAVAPGQVLAAVQPQ